tara:strand:- start:322 stop:483 length:162 start_codon:yes stop_codon:yes gene_type:complete
MKETLRRLAVVSVYVGAVLLLFLSDLAEDTFEALFRPDWKDFVFSKEVFLLLI